MSNTLYVRILCTVCCCASNARSFFVTHIHVLLSWLTGCRAKAAEEQSIEARALPKKRSSGSAENKRKRARSLNVIHSRLKRERRKAEEQDLREACERLSEQKDELTKEQAKLEKLLQDAQKIVQSIEGNHGSSIPYLATNLPKRRSPTLTSLGEPYPNSARACSSPDQQPAASPVLEFSQANHSPGQGQSLSSSINAIFSQPPEVQRFVLNALQDRIRNQQTTAAANPTPSSGSYGSAGRAQLGNVHQSNNHMPNHLVAPSNNQTELGLFSLLSQPQMR